MEFVPESPPALEGLLGDIEVNGVIDNKTVELATYSNSISDLPLTNVLRAERFRKIAVVATTSTGSQNRLLWSQSVLEVLQENFPSLVSSYGMMRYTSVDIQVDFNISPFLGGVFKLVYIPTISNDTNTLERGNSLNGIDIVLGEGNTSAMLSIPFVHFRNYWSMLGMQRTDLTRAPYELGQVALIQYVRAADSGGGQRAVSMTINARVMGAELHNPVGETQGPEDSKPSSVFYFPSEGPFNGIAGAGSLAPEHSNGVATSIGDTSMQNVLKHMFYEDIFSWSTSQGVGTRLYTRTLEPSRFQDTMDNPEGVRAGNLLHLMSLMTASFCGNLRMKLCIATGMITRGKLKVVVSSGEATDSNNVEQWPYFIFDVGAQKILKFELGPYRDMPVKRHFTSIDDPALNSQNLNTNVDWVSIFVEQPLNQNGTTSSTNVAVFVGGAVSGPGRMRFFTPRNLPFCQYGSPTMQAPEMEEEEGFVYIGGRSTELSEMPSGMSEVTSLLQLADRKDCKLFRFPDAPGRIPPIPVTPGLVLPSNGEGRYNKLPILASLFLGWKGSFEYYLRSDKNVNRIDAIPWSENNHPRQEEAGKYNGVLSGMFEVVETTSTQGFTVRDQCPNLFNFNADKLDWKAEGYTRHSVQANQQIRLTSYDSVTGVRGTFLQVYVGAGIDTEFVHYRGFHPNVQTYIRRTYADDATRSKFGTSDFPVNWSEATVGVSTTPETSVSQVEEEELIQSLVGSLGPLSNE